MKTPNPDAEVKRERAKQAKAVMPMIPDLLDAFDDIRDGLEQNLPECSCEDCPSFEYEFKDQYPKLFEVLEAIENAFVLGVPD